MKVVKQSLGALWGAGMMFLRVCEKRKEYSLPGILWGKSCMTESGFVNSHLIQIKGRNQYHRKLERVREFSYEKL